MNKQEKDSERMKKETLEDPEIKEKGILKGHHNVKSDMLPDVEGKKEKLKDNK